MKKLLTLFVLVALLQFKAFGQKYEMVIEKVDGSEVVFNTEDISRIYFRVQNQQEDNNKETTNDDIVGKWFKTSVDHVAAWKFNSDGTCMYSEWGINNEEYFSSDPEDLGKWSINGDQLNTRWTYSDGDYDDYTFTFSISDDGSTLTLTNGDFGKAGTYIRQ